MAQTSTDLEHLACADAVVAPLASLQAVALEAAEQPGWDNAVPNFESSLLENGAPLLHGLTLDVDPGRQRALLGRLADVLARSGSSEARRLRAELASRRLDPLALLLASLTQDTAALQAVAVQAGIESA